MVAKLGGKLQAFDIIFAKDFSQIKIARDSL
jgi:hypothetical protein